MRTPRLLVGLLVASAVLVGGAGPAAAANPSYPTSCGKAKPGSFFDVFVTNTTTCAFGKATYRAVMAEQDRRGGFVSAVTVRFRVKVVGGGRTTALSCVAYARAHGVHDFGCGKGSGGSRIGVLLDDFS